MLEICFNSSVKGALKIAQHCGDKKIGGAIGFIGTTNKNKVKAFFDKRKALKKIKREQEELQKQAISIGGNREDVLGISFYLSEGDIAAPIEFEHCPRKDFILSVLTFNSYDEIKNVEKSALEFWRNAFKDLERLKQGAGKIRIWVDSTPEVYCGLLFVADLLVDTNTEINIVPLQKKYQISENNIAEFRSWREVVPELFGTFLINERALTKEEICSLSMQWKELQSENAPLRVIKNNIIISADEDYYDNLIRNEFPKESCKIGKLIGNALGKQKIPTGDVFIARRIKSFIQNGELEIIDDNEKEFYGNIIKVVK